MLWPVGMMYDDCREDPPHGFFQLLQKNLVGWCPPDLCRFPPSVTPPRLNKSTPHYATDREHPLFAGARGKGMRSGVKGLDLKERCGSKSRGPLLVGWGELVLDKARRMVLVMCVGDLDSGFHAQGWLGWSGVDTHAVSCFHGCFLIESFSEVLL